MRFETWSDTPESYGYIDEADDFFYAIGDAPPVVPVTSMALGLGNIWRFRDPAVRAAHVAEWTRKA